MRGLKLCSFVLVGWACALPSALDYLADLRHCQRYLRQTAVSKSGLPCSTSCLSWLQAETRQIVKERHALEEAMAQAASLAPKHNEGDIDTEDDADDPDGKQAGLHFPGVAVGKLTDNHSVGLACILHVSTTCCALGWAEQGIDDDRCPQGEGRCVCRQVTRLPQDFECMQTGTLLVHSHGMLSCSDAEHIS